MTWRLYAITLPRVQRLRVRGIDDEPLIVTVAGRLAAVVGRAVRMAPPSTSRLRRYHAVQVELFHRLPVMLPARYGTAVESLEAVRLLLQARDAPLRRSLRAVRGRAQMTLRLAGAGGGPGMDRESPSHRSERGSSSRRVKTTGLAYLRQQAARERRARLVPAFDPVRPAVRRWIRAERVEWSTGVATIYHLVPRASAAAYARAVERAAHRQQVPLVVSGPFPPFAFSEG